MAIYIQALNQEARDLIKFQGEKFNPNGDNVIDDKELPALLQHFNTTNVADITEKDSIVDKVFPDVVSVEKTDDGNYMVKFSNGKEKKMLPDEIKEYADKNAPSVVGTAVKGTIAFLGLCCLTNPATAGIALLGSALMGTSIGSIAHNIWDSGRGVDMAKLANQTE